MFTDIKLMGTLNMLISRNQNLDWGLKIQRRTVNVTECQNNELWG